MKVKLKIDPNCKKPSAIISVSKLTPSLQSAITILEKECEKMIFTTQNNGKFYQKGIENDTCFTLLGFDEELLVASGTLYLYSIMPSNENPSGMMGQLTNIWVDDKYRRKGYASMIVKELLAKAEDKCGAVCLNSSKEAMGLYQKLGFKIKERYMVKSWD